MSDVTDRLAVAHGAWTTEPPWSAGLYMWKEGTRRPSRHVARVTIENGVPWVQLIQDGAWKRVDSLIHPIKWFGPIPEDK